MTLNINKDTTFHHLAFNTLITQLVIRNKR